eukprot:1501244-Amphidinium_carterae.1
MVLIALGGTEKKRAAAIPLSTATAFDVLVVRLLIPKLVSLFGTALEHDVTCVIGLSISQWLHSLKYRPAVLVGIVSVLPLEQSRILSLTIH